MANSGASPVSVLLYSPTQKEVIGNAERRPASSCRNPLNVSGRLRMSGVARKLVDHDQPGAMLLEKFGDVGQRTG